MLERRVGVPLFERHRSGARVTIAGERFLKEAEVGASHLHQAVNSVAQARRGATGALRVGLTACLSNSFLAALIADYRRRFPAIDVTFVEGTSEDNLGALLDSQLDVAFILTEVIPPGCGSEKLWEEAVYLAIPRSHPLAAVNSLKWDEVGRETFLVMADTRGPEIERYLVRQLSRYGKRPTISVQNVGCENLLSMIAQGFGFAIATSSAEGISYPGVCFVPCTGDEPRVSFSAAWSKSNPNPALKFMIEMSLERLQKLRERRRS
jgi:DNA-binding transcriptional LysR family regulator